MSSLLSLCLLLTVSLPPSLPSSFSCSHQIQSVSCLPVFSHHPPTKTKCYCTSICPSLETLVDTCFSGQLQTDPCGLCLQCAPGPGQSCGGFANSQGVCAGGLSCLIKYSPHIETEHNKTGVCVTHTNKECKETKTGVSCRPGQLGVPSDFVFCPVCTGHSVSGDTSTFTDSVTSSDPVSDTMGSSDTVSDSDRRTQRHQSPGSLLAGSFLNTLGSLGERVREAVMDTTG